MYNYKVNYWIPKLEEIIDQTAFSLSDKQKLTGYLKILNKELGKYHYTNDIKKIITQDSINSYDTGSVQQLKNHLNTIKEVYNRSLIKASQKVDSIFYLMEDKYTNKEIYALQEKYYNDYLADILKNSNSEKSLTLFNDEIVQLINPIFNRPYPSSNIINYRAHFYAPFKYFAKNYYTTYWFNITFIWMLTIVLYILLYFNVLKKSINYIENIFQRRS